MYVANLNLFDAIINTGKGKPWTNTMSKIIIQNCLYQSEKRRKIKYYIIKIHLYIHICMLTSIYKMQIHTSITIKWILNRENLQSLPNSLVVFKYTCENIQVIYFLLNLYFYALTQSILPGVPRFGLGLGLLQSSFGSFSFEMLSRHLWSFTEGS